MKKFNFKLEKILKLRTWTENDAKMELGRAVQALSEIENKIAQLAVKRDEISKNQYQQKSINDIQIYNRYLNFLDNEKENLIKEAAEAQLEVEKMRELWTQAKSEVKVMENLKDRRLDEYKKESRKES